MVGHEMKRAVSTWSLHRTLGGFSGADSAFAGGGFLSPPDKPPRQSLLDLLPGFAETRVHDIADMPFSSGIP